jgi:hypothetical protein
MRGLLQTGGDQRVPLMVRRGWTGDLRPHQRDATGHSASWAVGFDAGLLCHTGSSCPDALALAERGRWVVPRAFAGVPDDVQVEIHEIGTQQHGKKAA